MAELLPSDRLIGVLLLVGVMTGAVFSLVSGDDDKAQPAVTLAVASLLWGAVDQLAQDGVAIKENTLYAWRWVARLIRIVIAAAAVGAAVAELISERSWRAGALVIAGVAVLGLAVYCRGRRVDNWTGAQAHRPVAAGTTGRRNKLRREPTSGR